MTRKPYSLISLSLLALALTACGGRSTLSEKVILGGSPDEIEDSAATADDDGPDDKSDTGDGGDVEEPEADAGTEPEEDAGEDDPDEEEPEEDAGDDDPEPGAADINVGASCDRDRDCGGDGTCINEIEGRFGADPTETPDGYCSAECAEDEDCGENGVCYDNLDGSGICMLECEADRDCRGGYQCTEPAILTNTEQMTCQPIPEDDGNGGFPGQGGGGFPGQGGGGFPGGGFGQGNNNSPNLEFCEDNCPAAVDACVDARDSGGFGLPLECGFGGGFG